MVVTETSTIDLAAQVVTREGQPVRATPTEWGLLEILAATPDAS